MIVRLTPAPAALSEPDRLWAERHESVDELFLRDESKSTIPTKKYNLVHTFSTLSSTLLKFSIFLTGVGFPVTAVIAVRMNAVLAVAVCASATAAMFYRINNKSSFIHFDNTDATLKLIYKTRYLNLDARRCARCDRCRVVLKHTAPHN